MRELSCLFFVKLDREEADLLKSYEADEWASVDDLETEAAKYQEYVNTSLNEKIGTIKQHDPIEFTTSGLKLFTSFSSPLLGGVRVGTS